MSREIARLLKALSDETRLRILAVVLSHKEISCQDLSKQFSLSQPTMSHHLRKMIESGVLTIRKEGVAHFYSVNVSALKMVGINPQKLLQATV